MASMRRVKNTWFARVIIWDGHKQREKTISLNTSDKATGRIRLAEINRNEKDIKDGINIEFAWQNDDGETKVLEYSLDLAVDEYLGYLKSNGRRSSTIQRARECLRNLKNSLGHSFPVKRLTTNEIERFKSLNADKKTGNGLNIELTRIRAFVNWAYDVKDLIGKRPKVIFIKVPKGNPNYLTESDLNKINQMDGLDPHFKIAFRMYWQTGMRLREPFNGEIDGNWLEVQGEDSKSGIPREIHLTDFHFQVILEMKARYLSKPHQSHRYKTGYYSKVFKKVAKALGKPHLKFHNLRDTFAVMRYLETRDIYQVSKELGHSTVKVTEKYAKMSIRRIEADFPRLAKNYLGRKGVKSSNMVTVSMVTDQSNNKFVESGEA